MKKKKFKALYSDFHTNIHPKDLNKFDSWYKHSKKILDFWLIAYYPYEKHSFGKGLKSEKEISYEQYIKDFSELKHKISVLNRKDPDFPMFLGYEWQGAGLDGDHNVFFKHDGDIYMPKRYYELVKRFENEDAIGIPHHLAYELGHRGKNWETHSEKFSPIVEIMSQHGSSEYGITDQTMDRHIHMGPRTGGTSVFDGLNLGYKLGIICSGDNHVVPADQLNGIAGVWSVDNNKDSIWEAIINKRVFGCSNNKISLWFDINEEPMGSTIKSSSDYADAYVEIIANSKVKHIELIHNGELQDVYVPRQKTIKTNEDHVYKTKFEFGWGPNPEVYPITDRKWNIDIRTDAKIISVEPSFSNLGQDVHLLDDHHLTSNLHTYKTSHSGKWMGKAPITSEGFILELKGKPDDDINININGKQYVKKLNDIINNTCLIVELEDAYDLASKYFDVQENYRSDSFYHNAYKIRLNEAFSQNQYKLNCQFKISPEEQNGWWIIKAYQQDGQIAWSSPIWFE